jgi:ABC-type cobalamin/Fe3+-siderophores transport system ATPase subunit
MMKQGKVVAKGAPEKVLTGDILTQTYGDTVEVVQTVKGPRVLTI